MLCPARIGFQRVALGLRFALPKRMPRVIFITLFCLLSCNGYTGNRHAMPKISSCPEALQKGARTVLGQFGITRVSTYFPDDSIPSHIRSSTICPLAALAMAVRAYLHHWEPESLVSVSEEVGYGNCRAKCYFNRPTSLLGLVVTGESMEQKQLLPLPPLRDEVLGDYWIFFLSISDLSEHGYWALVPKNGDRVRLVVLN